MRNQAQIQTHTQALIAYDPWWKFQDQDDAWIQQQIAEEQQMAHEIEKRQAKINFLTETKQLPLSLEDTRTQQEIEAEYDAFMERLAREESAYEKHMQKAHDDFMDKLDRGVIDL